jgi:hypothetical protein
MNKDFHYYGTYTAARIAGYERSDALVIATAAQYVDELTGLEKITDPTLASEATPTYQGTTGQIWYQFKPVTKNDIDTMRRIWMSFHFLPGNFEKKVIYEGAEPKVSVTGATDEFDLLCFPDSELVEGMVNDINTSFRGFELAPYLTGLRMHVLADTWAHAYFMGSPVYCYNDVVGDVYEELENQTTRRLKFSWDLVLSDKIDTGSFSCSPPGPSDYSVFYLGHGRLGHLPDYGFMTYRYQPVWKRLASNNVIEKNNQEVFYNAFTQMVYALKCVRNNRNFGVGVYDKLAENYRDKIKNVLSDRETDQDEKWKQCIKDLFVEDIPAFSSEPWVRNYIKSGYDTGQPYFYFVQSASKHWKYVKQFLRDRHYTVGGF